MEIKSNFKSEQNKNEQIMLVKSELLNNLKNASEKGLLSKVNAPKLEKINSPNTDNQRSSLIYSNNKILLEKESPTNNHLKTENINSSLNSKLNSPSTNKTIINSSKENSNNFLKYNIKTTENPILIPQLYTNNSFNNNNKFVESLNMKRLKSNNIISPRIKPLVNLNKEDNKNFIQQVDNFMITEENLSELSLDKINNKLENIVETNNNIIKETNLNNKQRLLSSKLRQTGGFKSATSFRPNTASNNKIIPNLQILNNNNNLNNHIKAALNTARPFTAFSNNNFNNRNKNNIINININVYNVDPNVKYLNPTPVKDLLYINEAFSTNNNKNNKDCNYNNDIINNNNTKYKRPKSVRDAKSLVTNGLFKDNKNNGFLFQHILKTFDDRDDNKQAKLTIQDLK